MKRVLVTGGCGFIGSHVLLLLVRKYPQYTFVNYDCLNYCASQNNLKEILHCENYKFVEGNILNLDLMSYVLKEEKIDSIIHFAAQSHVDHSFGNSIHFTETNVLGTHTVLEAARVNDIKLFIHVSTDEVYGEAAFSDPAATEEHFLEPTNPYAASKAAAEFIVKSYIKCWNLPAIITRGNNVYGPHQYPEKIIPKFIHRLMRKMPLCIHGDGHNKRTYIYVEDLAKAFDVLLHSAVVGRTYNIGSNDEWSNLDVAHQLLEIFGLSDEKEKYLQYVPDRQVNDKRYHIDSEKMLELGWKPEVSWPVGLRKTVEWNMANPEHFSGVDNVIVPHPVVKIQLAQN